MNVFLFGTIWVSCPIHCSILFLWFWTAFYCLVSVTNLLVLPNSPCAVVHPYPSNYYFFKKHSLHFSFLESVQLSRSIQVLLIYIIIIYDKYIIYCYFCVGRLSFQSMYLLRATNIFTLRV